MLRTGLVSGAEQAFYRGASAHGALELYLPWPTFQADAWDAKEGEIVGAACSYDPDSGVEHEFTLMSDGEPVLSASDLESFEHFGTAEALLEEIRGWLCLLAPKTVGELVSGALSVVMEDDEPV